jgi:hypothetical protein
VACQSAYSGQLGSCQGMSGYRIKGSPLIGSAGKTPQAIRLLTRQRLWCWIVFR